MKAQPVYKITKKDSIENSDTYKIRGTGAVPMFCLIFIFRLLGGM